MKTKPYYSVASLITLCIIYFYIELLDTSSAHPINDPLMRYRGGSTNNKASKNNSDESNNKIESHLGDSQDNLYAQKNSPSIEARDEFDYRRESFLDRIRIASRSLLLRERDAVLDSNIDEYDATTNYDDGMITPQSDITRPCRHMTVVTTATLPWMTGTAVNPLLRAAHLVRLTKRINKNSTAVESSETIEQQWVTLLIPWLELEQDRLDLYPNHNFSTPADQEAYLRNWLIEEANMPDVADKETGLRIVFYPSRFHSELKSIFAMGDITSLIPDEQSDICFLEEPEHLNWFRAPGEGWSKKFNYVVGIVHTNYKDYASSQYHGLWTAPALAMISSAMVRAYCHKVIKLSDVLQSFAPEKEFTSNVHGVRSDFLQEGKRRAAEIPSENKVAPQRKAYFIGKIIWQKGFDIMLDLQDYYKECTGEYFPIDIFGSGADLKEIMRSYYGRKKEVKQSADSTLTNDFGKKVQNSSVNTETISASPHQSEENTMSMDFLTTKAFQKLEKIRKKIKETTEALEFDLPKSLHELRRQPIPAEFLGRVEHSTLKEDYHIFINPSVSEVLCTTTAEALAMGKFVIIPVHPSNKFFMKFPNCLAYRNSFEFVANLRWAMTHDPEPLTPELTRNFTWEAATERLVAASGISFREARERERLNLSMLDERIAWFHSEIGKGERGDTIRKVFGAGPVSEQVKYQKLQTDDEESEEGIPRKLFRSSFAEALRSTLANTISGGLPTLMTKSR